MGGDSGAHWGWAGGSIGAGEREESGGRGTSDGGEVLRRGMDVGERDEWRERSGLENKTKAEAEARRRKGLESDDRTTDDDDRVQQATGGYSIGRQPVEGVLYEV